MEMLACLLSGCFLMFAGLALGRMQLPDWTEYSTSDEKQKLHRSASFQKILRSFNNGIIIVIGAGIALSVLIPHGKVWIILWATIVVGLLICIMLALVDGLVTLASYQKTVPVVAERAFSKTTFPDSERTN